MTPPRVRRFVLPNQFTPLTCKKLSTPALYVGASCQLPVGQPALHSGSLRPCLTPTPHNSSPRQLPESQLSIVALYAHASRQLSTTVFYVSSPGRAYTFGTESSPADSSVDGLSVTTVVYREQNVAAMPSTTGKRGCGCFSAHVSIRVAVSWQASRQVKTDVSIFPIGYFFFLQRLIALRSNKMQPQT